MKRRFNYTGRKKIPKDRISITLNKRGVTVESFNATLNFDRLELPENAKVVVEAYYRMDLKRFDFGTVKNISNPDGSLEYLKSYAENLRFRVTVVDPRENVIAASAQRIRPKWEGKKPILDIRFDNIGQQAWRVDFLGDEGPVLVVNERIPTHVPRSQPEFIVCVLPAVLREVLMYLIFIDGIGDLEETRDMEEPDMDWRKEWIEFAKSFHEYVPILNKDLDRFDPEEVEKWVDEVVEEFCLSRTSKEWREFVRMLEGES